LTSIRFSSLGRINLLHLAWFAGRECPRPIFHINTRSDGDLDERATASRREPRFVRGMRARRPISDTHHPIPSERWFHHA
jgi:hypothetical protein